jgi:hypothetical protein
MRWIGTYSAAVHSIPQDGDTWASSTAVGVSGSPVYTFRVNEEEPFYVVPATTTGLLLETSTRWLSHEIVIDFKPVDLTGTFVQSVVDELPGDPVYTILGGQVQRISPPHFLRLGGESGSQSPVALETIGSAEAVGSPEVVVGPPAEQDVHPASVATAEGVGSPEIEQGPPPEQDVSPAAIESQDSVGSVAIAEGREVDGIGSAEAVGSPTLRGGTSVIPPRPLHPRHQPGQGSIWFDHIPFAPVETRQYLGCNLAELSGVRIELTVGEGPLRFMGGPQFNGFVVPEVRAADVELVPVTFASSGGAGRRVMY